MGRAGKGASKGRWSKETQTRGGRGVLNNIAFVPSASKGRLIADDQATANFSLRQEAQNTERRQLWNPDLKLRHARVAFVSGAHSTMDESADPAQGTQSAMSEVHRQSFDADEVLQGEPMAHLSIQDSPIHEIPALALKIEDGSDHLLVAERKNDLANDTSSVKVNSKTFFIDTRGSMEPHGTKLSPPVVRCSQSPEMSDSSNEIVVFSGRSRVAVNSGANHTSSLTEENIQQHSKSSNRRAVDIIDDPVVPGAPSTSINRHHHSPRLLSKGLDGLPDISMEPPSNSHKDSRMKRLSKKQADEEEIFADYIANIDDSDDQRQVTSYDLNIAHNVGGADHQTDELPDETAIGDVLHSDTNWDLSDLAGLEDLSTSSEDLANVGRVLSKRKRGLDVQYLVTEKGHAVDDARWIPLSSLKMSGAEKHIRIYESNISKPEEFLTDSEESENDISNHLIKVDLQKDMDNSLDEHDLPSRRRERLADEKIARLLSKQEELGLGSSNLLLYDGDEDGKDDHFLPSRKDEYIGALRNRSKTNRFTNHLVSTSAFTGMLNADALDDVDIIDQGRPNLRRKSKARRGTPGLELTDTEIENSIQLAWENDRAKKKIRKQEREELRAQGLLGKKNKPDLKPKYSEGISMADIKNEIEGFLLSSLQSLPLPSMGHRDRKLVHEIAHVLGLKSKSIGSGSSRFPVLYRTSRTVTYDENAKKSLEAQLSGQHFLPRRDKVLRKGSATMRKARGGGFNNAAVSYRDGEIVGAAAPELGQENKGRAMLEKMGWSTGTALGALNNKGIMQPLAHVVKTTKAGLG